MVVPDYAWPLVGWRSWLVLVVEGELRLCSPVYPTVWLPGQATRAVCLERRGSAELPAPAEHPAPAESCRCGIYASSSPATAASFMDGPILRASKEEGVRRPVFGRVSLWGMVVECERGWRAARAYPQLLYVPVPSSGAGRFGPPELLPPETVVRALGAYLVPVELLACETLREAAEALDQR